MTIQLGLRDDFAYVGWRRGREGAPGRRKGMLWDPEVGEHRAQPRNRQKFAAVAHGVQGAKDQCGPILKGLFHLKSSACQLC